VKCIEKQSLRITEHAIFPLVVKTPCHFLIQQLKKISVLDFSIPVGWCAATHIDLLKLSAGETFCSTNFMCRKFEN